MKFAPTFATPLLAALALAGGCGRTDPPAVRPAAKSAQTYRLTGVVRQVDAAARSVTIRHAPIAGFMDAMTMPFRVPDAADLDDVRPGDEVEANLRVEAVAGEVSDFELRDLVVTRPATPGPDRDAPAPERPAPLKLGEAVPDFAMTTQDGTTLRLSDLRGDVVVLTFIYTRCPVPNFCPLMDRKFAELAGRLAAVPARASRVRLLSVSFDPEHDTPEILKKHADSRGAHPPLWTFAVASHAELAKVAPPLGLTYGPTPNEIVHTLSTALIDADGRLVALEAGANGGAWKPSNLLKSIYSLLPPARR